MVVVPDVTRSKEAYLAAFSAEVTRDYPVIDELERQLGYRLDDDRLLPAARVLACPLKAKPPSWQHGRVAYAVARHYLAWGGPSPEFHNLLDVGTAKGFSALCLHWALADSGRSGGVVSVDVIGPADRVPRNTIAEVDAGPRTLAEILEPWPEAGAITFVGGGSLNWLSAHPERVHVAFLDGKHREDVVLEELRLLSQRQEPGDVVVLDDMQIPGVSSAASRSVGSYSVRIVHSAPDRQYAIATRRRKEK